jgi:hypothetical protein
MNDERTMSISNISTAGASAIKQAQVQQQVSVAVLNKVHQAANDQAEAALSLLESAVEQSPDAGGQKGTNVDVVA